MNAVEVNARVNQCSTNHFEILPRKQIIEELECLMKGNDFVQALRGSSQLSISARQATDPLQLVADLTLFAQQNVFASLLAMESLAGVKHPSADQQLIKLLASPAPLLKRHATWLLGRRMPTESALQLIIDQLCVGAIDSMHAHRTLRRWSIANPYVIKTYLTNALENVDNGLIRARLIDLIGVIEGSNELLLRIAGDPGEALAARIAAIGALGERKDSKIQITLKKLASVDDLIGNHAVLALSDLAIIKASIPTTARRSNEGLRIAQLVLTKGLDGQLSLGGRGDTGGVASLLVSLGEALARRKDVDHVLTIGRGSLADTLNTSIRPNESSLGYAMIAVEDHGRPAETGHDTWENLPSIKRGLRRVLQQSGGIDVLHLRMADAGTLAGSEVAGALGIPICFSAAPDPHNVIHALQSRNELDQDKFVQLCTNEHVWFRARLIEKLAERASRLVLFPRVKPNDLFEILGIGSPRYGQRVAVVSEGIDVDLLRRAQADYFFQKSYTEKSTQNHRDILEQLANQIPENRRSLPLLLSIGRFNPVKGMERVVAAWACDPLLHSRFNLVLVGGDLDTPSQIERQVLNDINQAAPVKSALREGLVLLGGRPRADIAKLLVATAQGRLGYWSKGGIYVDGALKEEFGLALIEALAAGLVVIAPSTGGPPTYVTHGDTGILVDPADDLAAGILRAVELVERPKRKIRAQKMVEERYSIETMAAQLASLYRSEQLL
ncbi:MAG: glycosyltransferase involved in cell wall biosynthesis [Oceanospirillaceae bacterium]|jgi:glycosyltransferase involved in cell wall biosynthesis